MKVFIVSTMILACAFAAPGVIDNRVESDSSSNKMMQYFSSCFDNDDITSCLAVKGIAALNRAARASNIQIAKGVVLTRDPSYARSGKSLSENEIVSSLPTESEERSSRLFEMATESMNEFFKSHSLQFKLPAETTQEVSRALEEGRGKLKKMKKPLLMLLGTKIFALVPLFLIGLAFLALKALVVSKIALALALILSVGKIFGGIGGGSSGGLGGLGGLGILGKVAGLSAGASGLLGGGSSAGGYANTGATAGGYANSGSSATGAGWSANNAYPYARSYDEAQDLAYSAHTQNE